MLRTAYRIGLGFLLVTGSLATADEPAASRKFLFTYQATVTGLEPGQKARVWLPVPPSDADQDVTTDAEDLPAPGREAKEKTYGNIVLYVEAKADETGTLKLTRRYKVTRRVVVEDRKTVLSKDEVELYLKPNSKVPTDGKPLTLIAGKTLPVAPRELGKALFDVVNDHMRYGKEGTGWGQGDAVWACDNKYGNCTDFHSLFMSLARARMLPTRFEIGFALPAKHGKGEVAGYHCWAKFSPDGKGWVPVDISEANKDPKNKDSYFGRLTADRVTFSAGRDLVLTPKQDGPPVNFFISPHVEVGGKPWPSEKVRLSCEFEDESRK